MVLMILKQGWHAHHHAIIYALIGITNILRHQGKEYRLAPVIELSCKHVEKKEHGHLAAIGYRDVLSCNRP